MSTPRHRLDRLEGAIPPVREPYPYDISRLTPDQMARCAQLNERTAEVGMAGLTDQEVEDGVAIADILLAPVWPIPEAPAAPSQWRTTWQRS